ncbi:unnamed protein product [Clonostachys rosea]|uniref:HRDC domain-containing protein n=1 Tax=Bionectria ochroleuca TaxID=29856 RepID=A0ABY6TV14_BIOOC|nr:unnamed protein product [Clonostachys rosea]
MKILLVDEPESVARADVEEGHDAAEEVRSREEAPANILRLEAGPPRFKVPLDDNHLGLGVRPRKVQSKRRGEICDGVEGAPDAVPLLTAKRLLAAASTRSVGPLTLRSLLDQVPRDLESIVESVPKDAKGFRHGLSAHAEEASINYLQSIVGIGVETFGGWR